MCYKYVRSDLQQAEKTINIVLRSNVDSEVERRALEETLNLVQQAARGCLLAQTESIRGTFSQGMSMERIMQEDDEKRGG